MSTGFSNGIAIKNNNTVEKPCCETKYFGENPVGVGLQDKHMNDTNDTIDDKTITILKAMVDTQLTPKASSSQINTEVIV